jgi:hypothetical protein
MKKFLRASGAIAVAGLALAACGSATHSQTGAKAINPPPTGSSTSVGSSKYGWKRTATGQPEFVLPHVGRATPTIYTLAEHDFAYSTQVVNPKYWVYSKTFGQWIFVGPYTSGVNYQRVRDAKLAAVNSMETDVLFAHGATSWPTKIGAINATVYGQPTVSNMPSVVATEQYDAKHYPGKTFTAVVPSVATIIESPVGMLTPAMMSNTPSQEQYSVPGTCIPHTFAVYFKGTATAALTGPGDFPNAVYEAQYGPTNSLVGANTNTSGAGYNVTTSCNTMP